MAADTSWATEVRWQEIEIADAAEPWRAGSESRSEESWLSASILLWGQSTQVPKC